MTNAIEAAVAPLKNDAIARAEQEATALIERLAEKLAANDWNVDLVAPQPNSMRDGRETYLRKQAQRRLYSSLFESVKCSRSMRDPFEVKRNPEREARFIDGAKVDAAAQYDAFVAKLTQKIGECDSAVLSGNHVWGQSILTVTKGESSERWKTQMIVNVSKLGKLFNQWPTRKVK
jgi:Asp-tRNA(Asn)/Glu-tRNA(Gln) amidotransferase A subunit family amidase